MVNGYIMRPMFNLNQVQGHLNSKIHVSATYNNFFQCLIKKKNCQIFLIGCLNV